MFRDSTLRLHLMSSKTVTWVARVSPDIATTVYADGTGGAYQLKKLEIELPDGTVKKLDPTGEGGNTYSYTVEPGKPYTFVAYYTPIAVVYHLNDTDIDGKLAQEGNTLGSLKGWHAAADV